MAAWLISNSTGRAAVIWAAGGAVAGGLFVGLAGNFFGGDVAVRTSAGDLSRAELAELDARNRRASSFFARLREALAERGDATADVRNRPLPNFEYAGAQTVNTMFGPRRISHLLGAGASREEGLVFEYLLAQEAEEAGLEVSDARVNALINTHFGVSPTRAEIRDIRARMGVGERDLFDAIRAEMRARDMVALLLPDPTPLPADAWDLYRRLNQTANLAVAELPAGAFVPQVAEPTDTQVADLFLEYRNEPPDPVTGLGFQRPSQIAVGYLRADREAVEEAISAPTDADVRAFYEENREQFRNPAYDDWLSAREDAAGRAEMDAALDENAAAPPAPGPDLPTLAPTEPAPEAPAPEENPEQENPDPEPAGEAASGEAMTEEPAAPAETPEPETPAETPEQPATPAEPETPAVPEADEPEAGDEGSALPAPIDPDGGETAARGRIGSPFRGVGLAMIQDDPDADLADEGNADPPARGPLTAPRPVAKATSEPPAEAPAPKPEDPPKPEPAMTEEEAPTPEPDPTPEPEPAPEPPEPAATPEPAMTPGGEAGEEEVPRPRPEPQPEPAPGLAAPPAPEPAMTAEPEPGAAGAREIAGGDGEDAGEAPPPAPTLEEPPEFLPLDAGRTESIRAELKRASVAAELDRRVAAAQEFMYTIGNEVWAPVPDPREPNVDLSEAEAAKLRVAAREEIGDRMAAYAKENGLTYKRLPFLSYPELVGGDYPVGAAQAPADRFARPQLAVDALWANLQTPLFNDVRVGVAPDGSARFAVWKANQRFAAPQELTDEGVREQVVTAYKRREAAKLAEKRADELAELASADGKTLAQVAEGRTVTGKKGGAPLEVRETGPFARLRIDRPTDMASIIQGVTGRLALNPVPKVPGASDELRDAAFDTLAPGQAAGVPGADPDRAFAVELLGREPSDERLSELYEAFLQDAATNPVYGQAGDEARRAAYEAFIEGLFEKYNVDRAAIAPLDRR